MHASLELDLPPLVMNLCKRRFRKAFTVGCILAVLQQLTGINVIIFYSHTIFAMDGAGGHSAQLAAVYVGAVMLACTRLPLRSLQNAESFCQNFIPEDYFPNRGQMTKTIAGIAIAQKRDWRYTYEK